MSQPPFQPWTIRVFVGVLVSLCLWLGKGHLGRWHWALAGAVLVLGALWPRLFSPLFRLTSATGNLVGRWSFTLLAALVYFMILTPIALLMRLRHRAFLAARIEKDRDSYYETSDAPSPFERQY